MKERLLITVAFLLLCGKATSIESFQVNTWTWCQPAPPKKAPKVLPPPAQEDVPVVPTAEVLAPTASVSQPETSWVVVTSDDIASRKSSDLVEVLADLGMQVITSGGKGTSATVVYRGYSGFDIKVYVDGVLANSSSTGEFDWNSIDVNTVETISVLEVPSGQAEFAGCIIQIKTKKTTFSTVYLDTSVSSYLSSERQHWVDGTRSRFLVTDKLGKHSYSVSSDLSYYKNEYFRNVSTPVNWDNFDRLFNSTVYWGYTGEKLTSELSSRYSNNYLKAYSTGPALSNGIQQDHIGVFQHKLQYDSVSSWSVNSVCQFRIDDTCYFVNNSRLRDESENTRSLVVDDTLSLEGPLSASLFYRDRVLLTGVRAERREFGASLGYQKFWKSFGFSLGSGFLVYGDSSLDFAVTPSLSLYHPFGSVSVYRAFVLPTFNQLYWGNYGYASGNPSLSPESGWGANLRLEKKDFPVFLSFTGSYHSNKIRWTYSNWRLSPENVSYVWLFSCQAGYSSYLPFKWFDKHLKIQTDVCYTRSWLSGESRQIMWVPQWKAHLGVNLLFKKFSLVLDGTYMGARYVSNLNYSQYPAYLLFDAALSCEPISGITLYLKCSNLMDIRVVHHDSYFLPSRSVVLGVQFRR